MKTIVVSAVNLVEAGTLAILKDCLQYLSRLSASGEYRVVAIVYKKELAQFPNIEYIETQWPKKKWINRLWYEYVSMKQISKEIGPVYLWFSLHDTTPTVFAKRRAVYCHNSFPFYKWRFRELFFAPKIVMFALFTKYFYRINIHRNNFLVVQQEWFRKAMVRMFAFDPKRIIVAPPEQAGARKYDKPKNSNLASKNLVTFIYAASPNSHKNFECICQAADLLVNKYHREDFRVCLTVSGKENKYAQWLYKQWGQRLKCITWMGFVNKDVLERSYTEADVLIFPSKVETWGLPISEFAQFDKPMLLADLPYAHETASGSQKVAFFDPDCPEVLAGLMLKVLQGEDSIFNAIPNQHIQEPLAKNWEDVFAILLKD